MGKAGIIPEDVILLVGSDLQARVRLEAVVQPLGYDVATRQPESRLGDLRPHVVVLDLDQLGVEGTTRWAADLAGIRTVGFYSHIDRTLGDAAAELGIKTFRRGRFWKELGGYLARG